MKSWLYDNDIEMYSTHNEEFITALKNNIYIYMSSVSKNVYINNLADIINKYNTTYHSTIKMEAVGVKSGTDFNFNKENNKEDRKFEVG